MLHVGIEIYINGKPVFANQLSHIDTYVLPRGMTMGGEGAITLSMETASLNRPNENLGLQT